MMRLARLFFRLISSGLSFKDGYDVRVKWVYDLFNAVSVAILIVLCMVQDMVWSSYI